MKRIILSFITIVLLWSCENNNVIIEGKIENGKDISIYLSKLNIDGTIIVDSTKLSSKGEFKLKSQTDFPQLYIISLSNGNVITTIAQTDDKLFFEGDAKDFAVSYKVKGSDDAEKAKLVSEELYNNKKELERLNSELKNNTRDIADIKKDIDSVIEKQRKFSSDFIINNGTSLAAYIALYQKIDDNTFTLNENKDIYYFRVIASSLKALYPESQYTKGIMASLDYMTKTLANAKLQEIIENAPNSLPEIDLPNINNENIKLSSLKGKYILLDFTILSNPNSVSLNNQYKSLYKKYKNSGLEIYQVGLDEDLKAWKGMINDQSINWHSVWNNENAIAIQSWNIKSVPANFLINKDFTIAGKNLFGKSLDDKLKALIR